ncbi:MAG: hypothetical protein KGJ58_04040 [Patescibacteria group bacterium]|nr:hypothetical protein [Patescibacteria group bacterium]MDE1988296.1 hypothetical protein [Patescibacteria group bacterium]MDE2218592.1 hypothetical protein [Patescibacteria group bacterium]
MKILKSFVIVSFVFSLILPSVEHGLIPHYLTPFLEPLFLFLAFSGIGFLIYFLAPLCFSWLAFSNAKKSGSRIWYGLSIASFIMFSYTACKFFIYHLF